ncbi:MAG: CDP-glycerol glycerophosphotransferase family protein [Clostridia bacterium]|nr:CDP-glycerol glycerophosphotransferase family protein [Clostridia bacterium]
MKTVIKKLYNAFLRLVEIFSRLLPLKDSVLFFSIRAEGHLLENSKCVYDALDEKKDVFAHCMPLSAKLRPVAINKLLTHKVIVTDDFLPLLRDIKLRPEQKVFQIWHAGGAFKKMGFDAPSSLNPLYGMNDTVHSQYDDVTVTAEGCREAFSTAFNLPLSKIHAYGLPRTDKLLNPNVLKNMRDGVLQRNPYLKNKKIYLYCPTFREDGAKRVFFDPKIDFEKLNNELSDDEVFIIRRHPTVKYTFFDRQYDRIIDLTGSESTLDLMSVASLLVTDYSSCIIEGSVLRLPMLFYCPDIKTYERGFYLSYPDDLPGEMITDPEKLLSHIRSAVSDRRTDKEEKFRRLQTAACDGNSTERIVNIIKSWLHG